MPKKKDNKRFVFNCEWKDILCMLPDASRLHVLEAIIDYSLNGSVAELELAESIAFEFIRKEIDWNNDKYEEICRRRSKAGKRGGICSGAVRRTKQNEANAFFASENEANETKRSKTKLNENENEKEQENENELLLPHGNMSNNNLRSVTTSSSTSEEVDAEEELNKKRNDLKNKANAIIDYYNERIKAEGAKLRLCKARTETRIGFITARLKDYGEEKVKNVVDKAVLSHALNYDLRIAPVDIEWIMRPNNFPKVMEGAYNNRDTQSSRSREYDLVHFTGENDPDVYRRMKEQLKQKKQ